MLLLNNIELPEELKNTPKHYTKKQKNLFEEFVKAFLRQDLENDNLFESVCQPNLFVLCNTEENKEVLDYLSISYEEDGYSLYTQNFDENCKFVREVAFLYIEKILEYIENHLKEINELKYPIFQFIIDFEHYNVNTEVVNRLLWMNGCPILKRFTDFVFLNTSKPTEKRFVLELN